MAVETPPDDVRAGAPDWMVTFADLMSLLLTFFVLLLSFSTMEVEKFNTLSGSIRSAFGLKSPMDLSRKPSGSAMLQPKEPSQNKTKKQTKEQLMIVKLREALEQAGVSEQGSIKVVDEGVVLQLDGDMLFSSGKAEIRPEGFEILDRLIDIARSSGGALRVEGHTDDVPIATSRYPSNWELSAARAGSAVRYMSSGGVPANRLSAVGFADTRPLAPNDSAQNRARNRRVEFLFISPSDSAAARAEGDRT